MAARSAAAGQVGLVGQLGPASTLAALAGVKEGRVYDLDSTRWHQMPVAPVHPPFQVLSYRTATGLRNQGDREWPARNTAEVAVISELVMGTIHTGAHIDGLSHVCCGPEARWYGGDSAYDSLGDFGALRCDATTIPPIITRGVLVDIAGHLGEQALGESHVVTRADVQAALDSQGVAIRPNDAVLIRTGYMSLWPDMDKAARHAGAGIDHEAAVHIAEAGAVLVAGDTENLEVYPSVDPDNPLPVHVEFLIERGIHIMELVDMEELAADRVYQFCFVCLPLPIRGATGSMVRPIAIV
jgi:kynurenine formamidase